MHTIEEIFALEPRLKAIYGSIPLVMASRNRACDPFWGNWSRIKIAFSCFVGDFGENPELAGDYETVYQHFFARANEAQDELEKAKAA